MPRNGSGTYQLPAGNPFVTGTVISSTVVNNDFSDIATALTASIAADGQTPVTANIPMNDHRITELEDGVDDTDAASVGQTVTALADPTSASDNAGMIVPSHALSYTAGTLGAWYNTYVTAKDRPYLATGDGTTDDAAAMNAALASGYKRVHFPFGTYKFNDHVTIPAGVSVTADPGTKWLSDGTADVIITGSATVKTVIEGILFDMNSSSRQVYGEGADNVTFRKCAFTGSTNNGLLMSVGPKKLLIDDCDFYSNTKAGCYIAGTEAENPDDIEIRSSRAYSNGDGGGFSIAGVGEKTVGPVVANYATNVRLVNCMAWDNGVTANSGFDVPYCDGLTLTACHAWGNFEHGAALQETSNFRIIGCYFYDNDQAGICCQSGFDPYNPCEFGQIIGCQLTGNAAVGLWFKEQNNNILAIGCLIINNTLHNVRFSDLGGSGLYSQDIYGIGCITEPSPGAGVTNSNSSLRVDFEADLNPQGQPPQPNLMTSITIATATSISTKGPLETYPELITLDNTVATNVARTPIGECIDGRRIVLRAYSGGSVNIQHNQGNGTTTAGFLNNSAATITLAAGKNRPYIGNGVNWVEEGV